MIKKRVRLAVLLTFLFTWGITSYSQDYDKIDSLKALLPIYQGEQKYECLEHIAGEFLYNNVDSCIKYASMLLVKATTNKDTLWMAKAEKTIGGTLCISGNLSTGLKHSIQAKEYYVISNFEEGIFGCTQNIGFIYNMMDEPQKAIKHFREAIPYFEKNKKEDVLEIIYHNLVSSLTITDQLDSATHYLKLLEKIKLKTSNNKLLGFSLLKADLYSRLNQLDSAKVYYRKEYNYSKNKNDEYNENSALIGLGKLHKRTSENSTALNYFEIAEEISVKNHYTRSLTEIYRNKAEIYYSIKNYKAAYLEVKKLQAIENEIFNNENKNNLAEVKIKYESEKRELELAKQKSILSKTIILQKNKEAKTRIIFIAIVFLTISLLINIYFQKRSRIKLEQQKKYIEAQQDKIVGSINYAKKIQDSILPPQCEIEEIFPSSFVFFKPKDIVSGDFYWFKKFGDVKIIATVDCIGHGVPGAFMSLIVNYLLDKHVTVNRLTPPGRILEKLHQELIENSNLNSAYQGMDMSLCIIHEEQKQLCFAGARNSIFIFNQGDFTKLEADPYSIGAEFTNNVSFKTQKYSLQKNDILYMYTDGFVDQFGGANSKKLNTSKFKMLIRDLETIKFKNIPNHINTFLQNWQGNTAQTDDILIFGVKFF